MAHGEAECPPAGGGGGDHALALPPDDPAAIVADLLDLLRRSGRFRALWVPGPGARSAPGADGATGGVERVEEHLDVERLGDDRVGERDPLRR